MIASQSPNFMLGHGAESHSMRHWRHESASQMLGYILSLDFKLIEDNMWMFADNHRIVTDKTSIDGPVATPHNFLQVPARMLNVL